MTEESWQRMRNVITLRRAGGARKSIALAYGIGVARVSQIEAKGARLMAEKAPQLACLLPMRESEIATYERYR